MFEDSTFESTGRIRTRSRRWMMAAFLFNGSILLVLILIPLIYPEALPAQWMSVLIEVPAPPAVQQEKPKPASKQTATDRSEIENGHVLMPPQIPPRIRILADPGPPWDASVVAMAELGEDGPGVNQSIFQQHTQPTVVHPPSGPVRVTSTIAEGLLLQKVMPVYPAIAKVTRREGTVVLQATISTRGTIENLRVVSGEPMLQQAALDAVKNWRYRPYLLNGQPLEVETTIKVIFRLGQ
jgi:protein TonB